MAESNLMRVAVITTLDLKQPGGVEQHILNLGAGLRGRGVEIDVFGRVARNDLKVKSIADFHPEPYHVIHSHGCSCPRSFFKFLLGKKPMQYHVHTLHGISLDYWRQCRDWTNWRCYSATLTEWFLSCCSDHIISVNQLIKNHAQRYFNFPSRKISVIYNGYDPVEVPVDTRQRIRQRYGLAADDFLVLFVGRGEDKVKGTDILAQSMSELYPEFPQLRLVAIPGSGFSSAAWFCPVGPVSHQDIPAYYQAADLFVNASLSEGLPLTVVEAMAAGLPIVAAQAGGIPEIIQHEKTGLLLRPDRGDLVHQIRRILDTPQLRETLGKNAQRAVQQLTWQNLARQTLAVYESVLKTNRKQIPI